METGRHFEIIALLSLVCVSCGGAVYALSVAAAVPAVALVVIAIAALYLLVTL